MDKSWRNGPRHLRALQLTGHTLTTLSRLLHCEGKAMICTTKVPKN